MVATSDSALLTMDSGPLRGLRIHDSILIPPTRSIQWRFSCSFALKHRSLKHEWLPNADIQRWLQGWASKTVYSTARPLAL